jgi:hypothetical protein
MMRSSSTIRSLAFDDAGMAKVILTNERPARRAPEFRFKPFTPPADYRNFVIAFPSFGR